MPFLTRVFSFFLTIFYFFSQVVFGSALETNIWKERHIAAAPPTLESVLPRVAPVKPTELLNITPLFRSLFQSILLSAIHIQDMWAPANLQASPILLIQDVHLNIEAQTNIATVLQSLVDAHRVGLVGVEGVFEELPLRPYREFPDKKILKTVSHSLFEHGLLAAPAYVGMTSVTKPPLFVGVDNKAHHNANVAAYLNAQANKAAVVRWLETQEQRVTAQKQKSFPEALAQFDELRSRYARGVISLGAYVQSLTRFSDSPDLIIDEFLQALTIEQHLDFAQVDHQRQIVLNKLSQRMTQSELQLLIDQSVSYRNGTLGFGDYYRYLHQLCDQKHISLSQAPAFDEYIRYVLLSDNIKPDQLFVAMDHWETRIADRLATTPELRLLVQQSDILGLMHKLVNFSLTAIEWEKYKRNKSLDPKTLPKSLQSFEDFYRIADMRSHDILTRLLALRQDHPADSKLPSVLVVGGFHALQLRELLKQNNVPYVVVSPKITRVDVSGASSYLSVFGREKAPLEKLFEADQLFVAPTAPNLGDAYHAMTPLASMEARKVLAGVGTADITIPRTAGFYKTDKMVREQIANYDDASLDLPSEIPLNFFGAMQRFIPSVIGPAMGGVVFGYWFSSVGFGVIVTMTAVIGLTFIDTQPIVGQRRITRFSLQLLAVLTMIVATVPVCSVVSAPHVEYSMQMWRATTAILSASFAILSSGILIVIVNRILALRPAILSSPIKYVAYVAGIILLSAVVWIASQSALNGRHFVSQQGCSITVLNANDESSFKQIKTGVDAFPQELPRSGIIIVVPVKNTEHGMTLPLNRVSRFLPFITVVPTKRQLSPVGIQTNTILDHELRHVAHRNSAEYERFVQAWIANNPMENGVEKENDAEESWVVVGKSLAFHWDFQRDRNTTAKITPEMYELVLKWHYNHGGIPVSVADHEIARYTPKDGPFGKDYFLRFAEQKTAGVDNIVQKKQLIEDFVKKANGVVNENSLISPEAPNLPKVLENVTAALEASSEHFLAKSVFIYFDRSGNMSISNIMVANPLDREQIARVLRLVPIYGLCQQAQLSAEKITNLISIAEVVLYTAENKLSKGDAARLRELIGQLSLWPDRIRTWQDTAFEPEAEQVKAVVAAVKEFEGLVRKLRSEFPELFVSDVQSHVTSQTSNAESELGGKLKFVRVLFLNWGMSEESYAKRLETIETLVSLAFGIALLGGLSLFGYLPAFSVDPVFILGLLPGLSLVSFVGLHVIDLLWGRAPPKNLRYSLLIAAANLPFVLCAVLPGPSQLLVVVIANVVFPFFFQDTHRIVNDAARNSIDPGQIRIFNIWRLAAAYFGWYKPQRRIKLFLRQEAGSFDVKTFADNFLSPMRSQAERLRKLDAQQKAMNVTISLTAPRLKAITEELAEREKFIADLLSKQTADDFYAFLMPACQKPTKGQLQMVEAAADMVWPDQPERTVEMKTRYVFVKSGSMMAKFLRIDDEEANARIVALRLSSGESVRVVALSSELIDVAEALPIMVHEGFHYRYQTDALEDPNQSGLEYFLNEGLIERRARNAMAHYLTHATGEFSDRVRKAIKKYLQGFVIVPKAADLAKFYADEFTEGSSYTLPLKTMDRLLEQLGADDPEAASEFEEKMIQGPVFAELFAKFPALKQWRDISIDEETLNDMDVWNGISVAMALPPLPEPELFLSPLLPLIFANVFAHQGSPSWVGILMALALVYVIARALFMAGPVQGASEPSLPGVTQFNVVHAEKYDFEIIRPSLDNLLARCKKAGQRLTIYLDYLDVAKWPEDLAPIHQVVTFKSGSIIPIFRSSQEQQRALQAFEEGLHEMTMNEALINGPTAQSLRIVSPDPDDFNVPLYMWAVNNGVGLKYERPEFWQWVADQWVLAERKQYDPFKIDWHDFAPLHSLLWLDTQVNKTRNEAMRQAVKSMQQKTWVALIVGSLHEEFLGSSIHWENAATNLSLISQAGFSGTWWGLIFGALRNQNFDYQELRISLIRQTLIAQFLFLLKQTRRANLVPITNTVTTNALPYLYEFVSKIPEDSARAYRDTGYSQFFGNYLVQLYGSAEVQALFGLNADRSNNITSSTDIQQLVESMNPASTLGRIRNMVFNRIRSAADGTPKAPDYQVLTLEDEMKQHYGDALPVWQLHNTEHGPAALPLMDSFTLLISAYLRHGVQPFDMVAHELIETRIFQVLLKRGFASQGAVDLFQTTALTDFMTHLATFELRDKLGLSKNYRLFNALLVFRYWGYFQNNRYELLAAAKKPATAFDHEIISDAIYWYLAVELYLLTHPDTVSLVTRIEDAGRRLFPGTPGAPVYSMKDPRIISKEDRRQLIHDVSDMMDFASRQQHVRSFSKILGLEKPASSKHLFDLGILVALGGSMLTPSQQMWGAVAIGLFLAAMYAVENVNRFHVFVKSREDVGPSNSNDTVTDQHLKQQLARRIGVTPNSLTIENTSYETKIWVLQEGVKKELASVDFIVVDGHMTIKNQNTYLYRRKGVMTLLHSYLYLTRGIQSVNYENIMEQGMKLMASHADSPKGLLSDLTVQRNHFIPELDLDEDAYQDNQAQNVRANVNLSVAKNELNLADMSEDPEFNFVTERTDVVGLRQRLLTVTNKIAENLDVGQMGLDLTTASDVLSERYEHDGPALTRIGQLIRYLLTADAQSDGVAGSYRGYLRSLRYVRTATPQTTQKLLFEVLDDSDPAAAMKRVEETLRTLEQQGQRVSIGFITSNPTLLSADLYTFSLKFSPNINVKFFDGRTVTSMTQLHDLCVSKFMSERTWSAARIQLIVPRSFGARLKSFVDLPTDANHLQVYLQLQQGENPLLLELSLPEIETLDLSQQSAWLRRILTQA